MKHIVNVYFSQLQNYVEPPSQKQGSMPWVESNQSPKDGGFLKASHTRNKIRVKYNMTPKIQESFSFMI